MIPYYDELIPEEQAEITELIRLLYRQTFVLERKYDRRSGRYLYNKDFRFLSKHLPFVREYLKISGIEVRESSQLGVIFIQDESRPGEKLPRLATLYILILKLIYDEQMSSASTSVHIITTLGEMNERLGSSLGLLTRNPPGTAIRQAVALLKKYQLIEPLDMMEGIEPQSRLLIYPSINAVLFGEDARSILAAFADDEPAGPPEKIAELEPWEALKELSEEPPEDFAAEPEGEPDDEESI